MKKIKLEVIIHCTDSSCLNKREIKTYIKDAINGWKKSYDLLDRRRGISKVTFKVPPKSAKIGLSK